MKPSLQPRLFAFVALFTASLIVAATSAQAPQNPQTSPVGPPPPPPRTFPAPANLKVLPKSLTGQQVHDIMKRWSGELGARCSACHAEDPESAAPDRHLDLNFADDSKPMKGVARLMYTMTEEINGNYIAQVEGSGTPVTCGTCHRGQVSPEPFIVEPARKLSITPISPSGEEKPEPQ